MKLRKPIAIILLIYTSAYADMFRVFHDESGREVEASLKSYNPETHVVKIKLRNNSLKTINASVFSKEDQVYINDWYVSDLLFSKNKFRLSATKKTGKSERNQETNGEWKPVNPGMKNTGMAYEITLDNSSGISLTNVVIKYCLYSQSTIDETVTVLDPRSLTSHEHYAPKSEEKLPRSMEINTESGDWTGSLLSGKRCEYMTSEIQLRDGDEYVIHRGTSTQHYRTVNDDLLGIRVRVYIPLPSGETFMKEFAVPDDLTERADWKFSNAQKSETGIRN